LPSPSTTHKLTHLQPLDLSTTNHRDQNQLGEVMRSSHIDKLIYYFPQLNQQLTDKGEGDGKASTPSSASPDQANDAHEDIHALCREVEEAYAAMQHLKAEKKAFAKQANKYWFWAILIDIRNRQLDEITRRNEKGIECHEHGIFVSAREYFALMPTLLFEKFMHSRARRFESMQKTS